MLLIINKVGSEKHFILPTHHSCQPKATFSFTMCFHRLVHLLFSLKVHIDLGMIQLTGVMLGNHPDVEI